MRPIPDSWQDLQVAVAAVLRDAGFASEVEKKVAHARGTAELDVYAEFRVQQHVNSLACECKQWKTPVPQTVVHAFRTVLSDAGIDAGYIVSAAGFQSGAVQAAAHTNVRLVTWTELEAIFEPEGPALAPGLRAAAEIVSGEIRIFAPGGGPFPWMAGTVISAGWVRRSAAGTLGFRIETRSPIPALQAQNERVGFTGFNLASDSGELSTDPARPTVLRGRIEMETPDGMEAPNPMTGVKQVYPAMCFSLNVTAHGAVVAGVFSGDWRSAVLFNGNVLRFEIPGSFKLRLI